MARGVYSLRFAQGSEGSNAGSVNLFSPSDDATYVLREIDVSIRSGDDAGEGAIGIHNLSTGSTCYLITFGSGIDDPTHVQWTGRSVFLEDDIIVMDTSGTGATGFFFRLSGYRLTAT